MSSLVRSEGVIPEVFSRGGKRLLPVKTHRVYNIINPARNVESISMSDV